MCAAAAVAKAPDQAKEALDRWYDAFLFEGIDEYLDPIIDPVLEKNLVRKGNARTVKIGDKDVECDLLPGVSPNAFGGQ